MTKSNLKQIALLLILAIFLIGFTFFQKDKSEEFITESNEKEQLAILEQKKAENMLSNFTVTYNSYSAGDFSNIESLYPLMTEQMAQTEKTKIERFRAKIAEQPKQYQTVTAEFRGLSTQEFEDEKIIANIIIFKQTFSGAYIQNSDKKEHFILVDQNGQPYSGDMNMLLLSKDLKIFQITGVKENGIWKVASMEESAPKIIPEENLKTTEEEMESDAYVFEDEESIIE